MKITGVKVWATSVPLACAVGLSNKKITARDHIIVNIETDEGITGLGYTWGYQSSSVTGECIARMLVPLIMGRDSLSTETLWEQMFNNTTQVGRKGLLLRAISAVDIALWDIKGKKQGLPLYKLLGGSQRDIPVYASGGYYRGDNSLEELADEMERYVILKESVEKTKFKNLEQLSFVKFISIGRKLLGFFDEISNWDLSIKDIENVKEKLHFPPQYIDEELPILGKIRNQYGKILKEKGFADKTAEHLSIAKNFKTEYLKDFKSIYIAGSLALTLTDALLIKKFLTGLDCELIIHCDKENLANDSLDNIFYHHNKTLKMLGADVTNIQNLCPKHSGKNSKTSVYIQRCKGALDEVFFVIDTICKLSPRYPLHKIGVILPDESLYLPLKDALEKLNIPYNLSMGIPFKHTSLYSFLTDACDFLDSDFSSSKFLALLKNPLIKGIIKGGVSFKELAYKLDGKIRAENLPIINRKIKHPQSQVLIDYMFGLIDKLARDCSFGEYVKTIREIIRESSELNNEFYNKTYSVTNKLMSQLVSMESSEIPDEFFPKGKDKLKFLINILQTINFPVSGDLLNDVQIIGILEARNIDFDYVIIPSCNEGIFPQKSEKDLFLPSNLRQEVKLPFYKERDALYCYYFYQLITGKKEVYLSYRSEEKTQFGLRNRWIEKLLSGEEKNFIVKETEGINSSSLPQLYIKKAKGSFFYKKPKKGLTVCKSDKNLNFIKDFTFSPSILKTYKQCPYKFYLSYLLKMKEPKTIVEDYDASMWGKIFHNALARLYNEKYPEGYNENLKQQVVKNLLEIGEEEFKKAYPYPKASLYWDWEANKQRILNLIDKEIAHFKEGLKPVKMEKELSPYTIAINNKQKVKIGGRPDRIDAKNEKFYIIDYKISKKPTPKTYRISKDFTEFQLPLYGLTFAKGETAKIGGLIYYHLDEKLQNFLQLDILKEEGKNYIKLFQEEILLPTLREIFDRESPFHQTKDFDICQRCAFIDHCRRRA